MPTITQIGAPQSIKDIQKLIGCMATLNRIISRLGKKRLPFFNLLKKSSKFEWNIEVNKSFERLKAYLINPPILTPP
jgi:hypothetical protein